MKRSQYLFPLEAPASGGHMGFVHLAMMANTGPNTDAWFPWVTLDSTRQAATYYSYTKQWKTLRYGICAKGFDT